MDGPAAMLGTVLAAGAAAAFGCSSLLQFRADGRVPTEPMGRPRLFLHLVRIPAWRWSVVLALAAGLILLARRAPQSRRGSA
ncbi:hypothetical protein [Dactylosporangium sp. CA-139066]|uniref:hypothetical protein n=1 Tax=Dactylosporangium sp. CA-139066 TaxID=3239930 RepID=UPI003D9087DF